MPEDKSTSPAEDQDSSDKPKSSNSLEAAMEEAMAAVEARERGDDEEEGGLEIEVESEDASSAVTEALIKAKSELEEVLKQTQKEAGHIRDKWLRAAADLENYRKRAKRERDEVAKFGNERLLKDFLPLIDDIERTVEVVSSSEGGTLEQLLDGVKLVYRKFLTQLEKSGATTFESVEEVFDPALHEAVQQMHSDVPAGKVVDQLQRGFMLHDRLLRPAMVTVSIGPEGKASKTESTDADSAEDNEQQ